MKDSKLIALLKALDRSELRDLSRFMESPFFIRRKEVIPFFHLLKRLHPKFPPSQLKKELLYQKLYPGKPFHEQHVGHLMNYLYKHIQEFLIINELKKDNPQRELYKIKALAGKKLRKHFDFESRKLTLALQNTDTLSGELYLTRFRFHEIKALRFAEKQALAFNPYLQELSDDLDRFYFTEKMKYAGIMINNHQYINETYEISSIVQLVSIFDELDFKQEPGLEIYQLTLKLLRNQDTETAYPKLKQLFQLDPKPLPKSEMINLLYYAFNFANKAIRDGKTHFRQEAFDLLRLGIESGILIQNDQIASHDFKNVIKLALSLKKYDWLEVFIPSYGNMLPSDTRENAMYYNLAQLEYDRGDLTKAQEHLNQVVFTNIFYQFDSKVLLMKIYYDQNELQSLESLIKSFSLQLNRKKEAAPGIRKPYQQFCRFMNRLLRSTRQDKLQLLNHLDQLNIVAERKWLRERVIRS